jgi:hypothetical protein
VPLLRFSFLSLSDYSKPDPAFRVIELMESMRPGTQLPLKLAANEDGAAVNGVLCLAHYPAKVPAL